MLNILDYNYKALIYAAAIALLILSSGALAWFGYSWYKSNRLEEAYQALTESIEEIDKAKTTTGQITWEEVIASLDEGAKRYSDTKLYPYFLVYKSEVLKNLNKDKESKDALEEAIKAMGSGSKLSGLYAIKEAFNKLNSDKKELNQEGFNLLEKLSKSKDGNTRQVALYYLGYYNYLNGNFSKAKDYWLELNKTGIKDTPWDALIKQYMPSLV